MSRISCPVVREDEETDAFLQLSEGDRVILPYPSLILCSFTVISLPIVPVIQYCRRCRADYCIKTQRILEREEAHAKHLPVTEKLLVTSHTPLLLSGHLYRQPSKRGLDFPY